ncbi:MAG TPA: hypothetical protein VFP56_08930 [Candidatus Limnocylindrales bacterium]|nr:hypothetical protein [Candidatus Limnocylindrales bacterium]
MAGEQVHDSPRESRMCLVHQPIEIATAPSKLRWEVGIELAGDPPDLREHHVFEAASLDERDNVLGDTGTVRKVVLAPAESLPKRAEPSTDPMIKHARIVRWDAYRAITDETEAVMPRAPWRRFVVARGTCLWRRLDDHLVTWRLVSLSQARLGAESGRQAKIPRSTSRGGTR